MKLKRLGMLAVSAMVAMPAIAQDYSEDMQKALEYEERAFRAFEQECRSYYHEIFFISNARFEAGMTKGEAEEMYSSDRYLQGSGLDSGTMKSLVRLVYDSLPDAPSGLADRLTREAAISYYAHCMGVAG